MAYASISGRARTDPRNPRAFGVCDRCGFWYNLNSLVWQHEWRGNELTDIRIRVCTLTCLDVPFQLNRPLLLPPDPKPVDQPRIEPFAVDEAGPLTWDQAGFYWDSGLQWDAKTGKPTSPPPSPPSSNNVIELESGTGGVELESGTGQIELEST